MICKVALCSVLLLLVFQTDSACAQVHLKGIVPQCYPITVADRALPIDSIIVDGTATRSPLPDSIVTAVLLGMQSSQGITVVDPETVEATSVVGLEVVLSIRQRIDSLFILDPPLGVTIAPDDVYQLVIPVVADTIVIDSMVTPLPWDGRSGGVVDLRARHVLIINDTIDATERGFRGGRRSINGGSCNIVQPCDPRGSAITAEKGEGCRAPDPTCISGHLPWGTGGGGGDAHNAGGGGGGNGGPGGRGGDQWRCGGTPGMWGFPGNCVVPTDTVTQPYVLTLGGGGGGGHQNNNAGTDGAAGGGLIRLRAPRMRSDSLAAISVRALGGTNTARAGNDGAGGGGAGGTVELRVCTTESPLHVDVSGGGGGTCDAGHGPGGGGAGGRVIIHPVLLEASLNNLEWVADGGRTGVTSAGDRYGAEGGTTGVVELPCSWTSIPAIRTTTATRVGDTMSITIDRVIDVSCATAIAHDIMIVGDAVTPIRWDSTAAFVEQDRSQDTTRIQLTLPSELAWTVDLLAVLGRDTTATITVRSTVAVCAWEQEPITVNVTACALPERRISLTTPVVLEAQYAQEHGIRYSVQLPHLLPYSLRLIQVDGRVVWERSGTGTATPENGVIDASMVHRGFYILLLSTPWGVERRYVQL